MNKIIIGETCLLDKQLRRCGVIDSAHGCFDNVMVNLDGIFNILLDDFEHLVSPDYLKLLPYLYYKDHNISHTKYINTKYCLNFDNIYSWDVMSFFHLDGNFEDGLASVNRKIERTKLWMEEDKPTILYYYYKQGPTYNISKHLEKLMNFSKWIDSKYQKSFKIVNITNVHGHSDVEFTLYDNILDCKLTTLNSWIGIDENWDAHTDDALFDTLFQSEDYLSFVG